MFAYHRNRQVSGIQRVQMNLIRLMASRYGNDRVRCLFFHQKFGSMVEFSPEEVFFSHLFEPERMLLELGMLRGYKWLPVKLRVKEYLYQFKNRKILRAWKKMYVYFAALFFPQALRRLGLSRVGDLYPDFERVKLQKMSGLDVRDSLVFLGANWSLDAVIHFGRKHAADGGDVVQMVYDLIPHLHPAYCTDRMALEFGGWLSMVTDYVSRFVCISECTASDLRQLPQVMSKSPVVSVAPLAHEMEGFERNSESVPNVAGGLLQERDEFALCVGTIEIRKNGVGLLRGWLRLYSEFGEQLPRLIFAGRHGWKTEEFDALLASEPVLHRLVKVVESPSDIELASLYRGCLFTVYPSFYEGWGLPIGEAAWFGKYCVTSSTSSMPEVCGDLAGYANPHDLDSIVAALRRPIADRGFLKEREACIQQADLRAWKDVADNIFSILASVN